MARKRDIGQAGQDNKKECPNLEIESPPIEWISVKCGDAPSSKFLHVLISGASPLARTDEINYTFAHEN